MRENADRSHLIEKCQVQDALATILSYPPRSFFGTATLGSLPTWERVDGRIVRCSRYRTRRSKKATPRHLAPMKAQTCRNTLNLLEVADHAQQRFEARVACYRLIGMLVQFLSEGYDALMPPIRRHSRRLFSNPKTGRSCPVPKMARGSGKIMRRKK